eukprot:6297307-Prorocentrum_lima.AAC.1
MACLIKRYVYRNQNYQQKLLSLSKFHILEKTPAIPDGDDDADENGVTMARTEAELDGLQSG